MNNQSNHFQTTKWWAWQEVCYSLTVYKAVTACDSHQFASFQFLPKFCQFFQLFHYQCCFYQDDIKNLNQPTKERKW